MQRHAMITATLEAVLNCTRAVKKYYSVHFVDLNITYIADDKMTKHFLAVKLKKIYIHYT